jgi:UDP-N-acetylmuramoyl-tripeptide--D-alanyl-D-alanine ligase
VQVDDVGAAVAALDEWLRPRDVVLIKGSRVAGLERVAEAVLAVGGDDA